MPLSRQVHRRPAVSPTRTRDDSFDNGDDFNNINGSNYNSNQDGGVELVAPAAIENRSNNTNFGSSDHNANKYHRNNNNYTYNSDHNVNADYSSNNKPLLLHALSLQDEVAVIAEIQDPQRLPTNDVETGLLRERERANRSPGS